VTCRVTGENTNSGAYVTTMIAEVVDEIKREINKDKIVSMTTDNASNIESAWAILKSTRPGFLDTRCAAHTLNLLVKDTLAFSFLAE
jgi:ABC-type antimicrobial peptide transport system permease subunit